MHGVLAYDYNRDGGAQCRITGPAHITVTEQDNDGHAEFTDLTIPAGRHVVPSVFKRAACVYVSVREQD